MTTPRLLLLTLAAALACDDDPDDPAAPRDAAAPPIERAATPADAVSRRAPLTAGEPAPVMPGGRRAFEEAIELIEARYVDRDLDLDALYTGALEGALARLYQVEGHPVNVLMGPQELAELEHGTRGSIVGIGVEINLLADVVVVRHALAGGPAAAAGLKPGDRILAIDGASVKGLALTDVVAKIRGEAGTTVDLFVQRDTDEWHEKLVRATIPIPNVEARTLGEGLAYLHLRGFAETTPAELDAALAALQKDSMRALVLDLRQCPGGLVDAAIATTGRFLRKGQVITTVEDREKGRTRHAAQEDGAWRDLPIAALIGPDTASGAEILAEALSFHGRATLIGAPTLGKGSVEGVHELSNGWSIKLSSGRFLDAAGASMQGRGVRPHLPIPADRTEDADSDPALAVATTWLKKQVL